MIVALGSKNSAKVDATQKVLGSYFSDFELVTFETDSGISQTPFSDEEGLLGAHNRLADLKGKVTADVYIVMEGIVRKISQKMFVCGWTIVEYNGIEYSGCSALVELPDKIVKQLNPDIKLGELIKKYYPDRIEEVSLLGTNGLLTNGRYTRVDEFTDSLICALSCALQDK